MQIEPKTPYSSDYNFVVSQGEKEVERFQANNKR